MKVLSIIILVIVGLLILVSFFRKKPVPSARIIAILAILGVGMFGASTFIESKSEPAEIPYYQQVAPEQSKAPYMLITSTRTYYVADYYQNDQFLTLQKFYYFDKKKWQQSEMPLILDKAIPSYSNLQVIKRGG